MIKFSLAQTIDLADENERAVFNLLSAQLKDLEEEWLVIWGYTYTDRKGETREGDFLVLGPDGGLLVIEVKGCMSLAADRDGNWIGHEDGNPFRQLDGQWKAIRNALNGDKSGAEAIAVARTLAVPQIHRAQVGSLPVADENGARILPQEDLAQFESSWHALFKPYEKFVSPHTRGLFLESPWGKRLTESPWPLVSDLLDAEIYRFTRATFPLLDYLQDHRRFAFSGAPGSGKTWLLLEQALRWAGRDGGPTRQVLVLCFNKGLEAFLKSFVERYVEHYEKKAAARLKSRIQIRSWGSLVQECLKKADQAIDPPEEQKARQQYFADTLPAMIAEVLERKKIRPAYDALVVDEAQDHDTAQTGALSAGWWTLYRALLGAPDQAPIAVGYDQSQRADYTGPARFAPATLLSWLGPETVRARCPRALRYTPALAQYLAALAHRLGKPFEKIPANAGNSFDGAAPVEQYVPKDQIVGAASHIIAEWLKDGRGTTEEIVVIDIHSWETSLLKGQRLAGRELVEFEKREPGKIAWISAARCKGIEARAVVVFGFRPVAVLNDNKKHEFFMAATRARQLLAVVGLASDAAAAQAPAP